MCYKHRTSSGSDAMTDTTPLRCTARAVGSIIITIFTRRRRRNEIHYVVKKPAGSLIIPSE